MGRIELLLLGGIAVAVIACGPEGRSSPLPDVSASGPADPTNAEQVALGELVYQAQCSVCHGINLEGQPAWRKVLRDGGYPAPPHNGSGHTWRHGDQQLFEATLLGGEASAGPGEVSHMPGFRAALSDEQIWAAIAYIKSHWPAYGPESALEPTST